MSESSIIEKIKKLLALSSDPTTTEHERDVALNRAKDLMAQHCIEEYHLKTDTKIKEAIVQEIYTPKLENPLPAYFHNPLLLNTIIQPIANNFGCYTAYWNLTGQHFLMGFKENVEIAKYACDVLLNQGIKDMREGYKTARSIGFTVTFWNGFVYGLHKRFIKLSNETAITLYDKVKAEYDKITNVIPIHLPSSNEASGFASGKKSAMDAQLNPAVSKGNGGNLLS